MVPTNDFLPFCPTDTGTNLLSQSDYLAAADRVSGNKPGIASAKLVNKALRQATAIAAAIAQMIANKTGSDALDDGEETSLLSLMNTSLIAKNPVIQKFTSGSGTYNKSYIFGIVSGSATAGATYTNNAVTYTVSATVSGATSVTMTGSGAPSVSGTLTKASGTGDATLSFYAVAAPLYVRLRMVGGGGGGGGSGTTGATDGSAGGDTTFGSNTASGGGGGGKTNGDPGAGGAVTLSSSVGLAVPGGYGGPCFSSAAGLQLPGGVGGNSILGGGGSSKPSTGIGIAGATNTGGGGGGAFAAIGAISAAGGGAGGGIDVIIQAPLSTYAYGVGAAGAAGSAGTGGTAGAAGAAGIIEVTEYFQ